MLGSPIYGHPVDTECPCDGGVRKSSFEQDTHARLKSIAKAGGINTQVPDGFHLQKWGQLPAPRQRCEFKELRAPRHFARLGFASIVPP
jgi:hypothetical protein